MSKPLYTCLLLFLALFPCLLVALFGGWFTENSFGSWYADLDKPFWNPPRWIFPLIWTPLYVLMGLSLWFLWLTSKKPLIPTLWFYFQLTLNLAWSPAFFFFHCSSCALSVMILLIIALIGTIRAFYKESPLAGWLLVPYLVWVLYAASLNIAIVWMN